MGGGPTFHSGPSFTRVRYIDTAFQSLFYNASEFAVDPEDTTVEVNDTDVLLTCMPRLDNQFITWQLFLRNGTFWTIDGSDVDTHRSR